MAAFILDGLYFRWPLSNTKLKHLPTEGGFVIGFLMISRGGGKEAVHEKTEVH